MPSRRKLEEHRRSIEEIRDIMNSMKTLAYMETRKLDHLLDTQHTVVNSIEIVATDFVSAYPEAMPGVQAAREVYLVIGSERGFCGDFNETLLRRLEGIQQDKQGKDSAIVVATGQKLHASLPNGPHIAARLDGASVAEEVEAVLPRVVDTLAALQTQYGTLSLYALYHAADDETLVTQRLLPPFQDYLDRPPLFSLPPVLNLTPTDFLIELSDHYLFAALHEIFYASLMAENRRRVQHLEGAVKHLEEESDDLRHQSNARRQEEIIEEIEVILLSAASLQKPLPKRQ
jgi:F-type H+-transporting ATPase subunit gamma